tara:strand:+ start:624 stop:824 length:201 start_codon:yes stop_codon:yes gene_type:complete
MSIHKKKEFWKIIGLSFNFKNTYSTVICPDAKMGNAHFDSGMFSDIKTPAHTNINDPSHFNEFKLI